MKFLFVLAQLGAAVLYVNQREAKCTLLIDFVLLPKLGLFLNIEQN